MVDKRMHKEIFFEDGYHAFGELSDADIRRLKNDHGLIIREENYRIR